MELWRYNHRCALQMWSGSSMFSPGELWTRIGLVPAVRMIHSHRKRLLGSRDTLVRHLCWSRHGIIGLPAHRRIPSVQIWTKCKTAHVLIWLLSLKRRTVADWIWVLLLWHNGLCCDVDWHTNGFDSVTKRMLISVGTQNSFDIANVLKSFQKCHRCVSWTARALSWKHANAFMLMQYKHEYNF